jgi:hypothetical protein
MGGDHRHQRGCREQADHLGTGGGGPRSRYRQVIVPELIVPELIVPELIVPELIVKELILQGDGHGHKPRGAARLW